MTIQQLTDFFAREDHSGVLSTADQKGNVNAAIFGSGRLLDEKTLVFGLGDNRTLGNLKQNPQAVFLCFEQGTTVFDWHGARIYLEAVEIISQGSLFDDIVSAIMQRAGRVAARSIRAVVVFTITGIRPLVDLLYNHSR